MHRSARIIFSLSFHLGKMTPEQAIRFLVDTVDFERANAEAEVRRSFNGSYPPLYQIGYMIGGLQIRALHPNEWPIDASAAPPWKWANDVPPGIPAPSK